MAQRKLTGPREAGADVLLVAPELTETLATAAAGGEFTWAPRCYVAGDLDGAALVVAATADAATNDRVAADAQAQGTPCVRVDDPAQAAHAADAAHPGSAAFPATVRRGPLQLAVATGGAAPALASRLRAELEQRYPPEYGELARLLGDLRQDPKVQAALAELPDAERRLRWRAALEADTLSLIRQGRVEAAKEVASACLCSSSD